MWRCSHVVLICPVFKDISLAFENIEWREPEAGLRFEPEPIVVSTEDQAEKLSACGLDPAVMQGDVDPSFYIGLAIRAGIRNGISAEGNINQRYAKDLCRGCDSYMGIHLDDATPTECSAQRGYSSRRNWFAALIPVELINQFLSGLIALRRFFLEALQADRLQVSIDNGIRVAWRCWFRFNDSFQSVECRVGFKGWTTGE